MAKIKLHSDFKEFLRLLNSHNDAGYLFIQYGNNFQKPRFRSKNKIHII